MGGLTAVSMLLKQDNSDEQCWSTTKLISELVTERWTKVSLLWRNFSHSLFLYSMENLTKKKETGAWGRWLTGVRIQTNSLEKSKPSWGPSQMRCVEVIVNSHFFPVPENIFVPLNRPEVKNSLGLVFVLHQFSFAVTVSKICLYTFVHEAHYLGTCTKLLLSKRQHNSWQ